MAQDDYYFNDDTHRRDRRAEDRDEEQATSAVRRRRGYVVVAYKETTEGEYEDGTTHVFGPYDDETLADQVADAFLVGHWATMALPIKTLGDVPGMAI